jgi:hypothetical protein
MFRAVNSLHSFYLSTTHVEASGRRKLALSVVTETSVELVCKGHYPAPSDARRCGRLANSRSISRKVLASDLFVFTVDLVVRVPGYRSTSPGSIPGATQFSEK